MTHKSFLRRTAQIFCLQRFFLVLAMSMILIASSHAAPTVVLEENFDGLLLGSMVPGWIAVEPNKDSTLPVVQNVSFKSAPHGMAVANDFYVSRPFNPVEGIVTIELWWNPKKGSDTNSFLRLEVEGVGSVVIVGKNETDQWRYVTTGGAQISFTPVDGQGHDIKVVYKTSTGTYDLFFDRGLIQSNVSREPGILENKRITGISLSSGRGGSRTTSYIDDLRVSGTIPPPPPPLLPPAEPIVLNETYDGLSPGTPLSNWTPGVFAQRDTIPPGGGTGAAQITWNIPSAYRDFPLLGGIITVDVWMKPKRGSDTNHGLHLGNHLAGKNDGGDYIKDLVIINQNDQDKWFYSESINGASTPVSFANYDGNWHSFRVVYHTATNRYTLYMDSTLVRSDILSPQDLSDGISHVGMNSGRFGRAPDTTSYFDELKVYGHAIANLSFSVPDKVGPGEVFTVDIFVEKVTNLAGFQLNLLFNKDILEATKVEEGDFLKQGGASTFWQPGDIDNTKGTISGVKAAKLSPGGVNGTGILMTVTFKAKKGGESVLELQKLELGDASGKPIPHQMIVGKATVVAFPPWDVNQDGKVDIFDLILVAQNFGRQPIEKPRVDVKADGNVDIFDLITVAQHFGESTNAAAPPAPQIPGEQHRLMLEHWLIEARVANDGSETFRHGIAVLEHLLSELVPKQTALLPNYPNPFNPETWIPYRLAKNSPVTVTIHDTTGKLVRTIRVGHQPAAVYESKDKAIYWDGRNDFGEQVSSGIYFYTLTTNGFTATRKMILVK